jgi:glucose-1-phosphate cytidylyltransferase
MKAVILAGGLGTRISEETDIKPKPMVLIGGKPILWHIMKIYSHYGINDFVICCGYKGYVIKEYFANYFLHMSDITFDLSDNSTIVHRQKAEPWKVTLVDTGNDTMTGGRIKRIKPYIHGKPFMLTYGDGLADINLKELLGFHQNHGKLITMTAVQREGRFGSISTSKNNLVEKFEEKPRGDGAWINGGYMVCQPEVVDYIEDDKTVFELEPMNHLARDKELMAFQHSGFWKPMDTLQDKVLLETLWKTGQAPWKISK